MAKFKPWQVERIESGLNSGPLFLARHHDLSATDLGKNENKI